MLQFLKQSKFAFFCRKYIKPELIQAKTGFFGLFKKGFKSLSLGIFDIPYFFLILLLTTFGLIMHYSASYKTAEQIKFVLIGMALMFLVSQIKVSEYKDISCAAMVVATVGLIAVLFFADEYHGTKRWIMGFQPSELAKVTLIMFMAYLLDKYKHSNAKGKVFWAMLLITCFYGILIMLEHHLSGTIMFLCIGFAMMWYSGYLPRQCFLIVLCLVGIAVVFAIMNPGLISFIGSDYQADRIIIWKKIISGAELTKYEKQNNARQVLQSLYAIGSGGFHGLGLDNSIQKAENLQEQANDFIFAVIGEEFGFIGGVVLILFFGFLVYRGFKIGLDSDSYYGQMVCFGVSTQIALQVLINISVATSLLPNTGISLPFFSEGGSSMLITMLSMGLVLGVSRENNQKRGNYILPREAFMIKTQRRDKNERNSKNLDSSRRHGGAY